jgi:hypothetical protein
MFSLAVAVEGLGPEEGRFGGKKACESGTMSKYPGRELEADSSNICAGEGASSVMVVEAPRNSVICKRLKLRIVSDPVQLVLRPGNELLTHTTDSV